MAAQTTSKTRSKAGDPFTIIVARGSRIRHLNLGRSSFYACLAAAGALAVSCVALPSWQLMRDDVVWRMTERQEVLRRDYESRIAELRDALDAARSRQALSEQRVETKVNALLVQQDEIAERYATLRPLIERAEETGVIPSKIPLPQPNPRLQPAAAPSQAGIGRLSEFPIHTGSLRLPGAVPPQALLDEVRQQIDMTELRQLQHVDTLVHETRRKTTSIAAALRKVGVAVPGPEGALAQGGPFVPASEEDSFMQRVAMLEEALERFEHVRSVASTLPFFEPIDPRYRSSSFGVRKDPFLGRRALHAGVDYAVPHGTVVRTTAPGKVVRAESAGGYGNLVEIDHGHGVRTRFAHLSRISVEVGEKVEKDHPLGRVGSTGRSTGPHLHYEVIKDGRAVDPDRFRRTGREIQSAT